MRAIYKYRISVTDIVNLQMNEGAVPLSVQLQDGIPTLWAMVDLDKPIVERKFRIFGTGNLIPSDFDGKYIGTFQQDPFVWHLFDLTKTEEEE